MSQLDPVSGKWLATIPAGSFIQGVSLHNGKWILHCVDLLGQDTTIELQPEDAMDKSDKKELKQKGVKAFIKEEKSDIKQAKASKKKGKK